MSVGVDIGDAYVHGPLLSLAPSRGHTAKAAKSN